MKHQEKIKMFKDIFAPKSAEKVLVLIDIPHGPITDNNSWKERRKLAQEWYTTFSEMGAKAGFSVNILEFRATGMSNSAIPNEIIHIVKKSNLVIAMTEFSASSSLHLVCHSKNSITRCASMPGVERRMEETAFKADYQQVKKYAICIAKMLNDSEGTEIVFSTGDTLYIDLRNRTGNTDTGDCTQSGQFINFPSGEACKAPYEAEKDEIDKFGKSKTQGILPVSSNGELMKYIVKNNRIVDVIGNGKKTEAMRLFYAENETRRNIAELGIGCNPKAVVTGNALEDEKAGLHIAYGLSTHLGGKVKSDVHHDICYSKGCPIEGTTVHLIKGDGSKTEIIRNAMLQYHLLK